MAELIALGMVITQRISSLDENGQSAGKVSLSEKKRRNSLND